MKNSRPLIRIALRLLLPLSLLPGAAAATYESEPLKQGRWDLRIANFRLRTPDGEAADKPFRGVLVLTPGTNGDGRGLVDQPVWREMANRWRFATVGVHLEGGNDYSIAAHGSGDALVNALTDFAHQSHHPELASSPLVMWGESAGGVFNYGFACWKPERVIAFVAVVDGIYGARATPGALHVPAMIFADEKGPQMGRVDVHQLVADNRRIGAHWSEVDGHGGKTDALARVFFDEEIALRMPPPDPTGAPPNASGFVHFFEVAENKSWFGNPTTHEVAPQDKFTGQRADAVWLPSETVARAWAAFTTNGKVEPLRPVGTATAPASTSAGNPAAPKPAPPAARPAVPPAAAPATAPGAARVAHLRRAVAMQVTVAGQPGTTITLPPGTVVNVLDEQAGQVLISFQKASATVERTALDLP